MTIHGRLSIASADGVVERDATGIEEVDAKGYGDAVRCECDGIQARRRTLWTWTAPLQQNLSTLSPCSHGRCVAAILRDKPLRKRISQR